ncbi:MAG: DMT family transporter, partial [Flavobacterium sp.]|nr:DMT family transporter [Flavobacterium sp.]
MLSDNLKSQLKLHLIVFIWGFTAILGKFISLEALPLVWFRMLFAVGFIFIYIKFKKIATAISAKTLLLFLLSGCIIALHWFTFFKAIKVSNVSVTLACLATGSFFAAFLEPLFYKKKVVYYEAFFGVLVFIGVYVIFKFEGNYTTGILLALLSAFLSALFAVINSKFVKEHDATIISFYELGGGVLFLTLILAVSGGFSATFFQLSINDFWYLMLLSSICTAYAFIVSTSVMKFLSPFTVMLTINLEPIYGIVLALFFFKNTE